MKKFCTVLLILAMMLCLSVGAMAAGDYVINESALDIGEFFSREELNSLNARAEELWQELGVAPYFILVDDTDGMTTGDYSEWYYLEHDFIPVDAIVMIANIELGETKVYADGSICLDTLVVDDLDAMKAAYDENETYGGGVWAYFNVVEKCLGFDPAAALIIAVIAGAVVALITALVLRGQLKSVRAQRGAADYTRPGSLYISSSYENFLYRHVDRTAKPKDDGGSSGGGGTKTGGGLRSN